MSVEIAMPGKQQGSIGRRLFAMAAPVAGMAIGGPAGAAVGGMIGAKMSGANTQDALFSGAKTGLSAGGEAPEKGATPSGAVDPSLLQESQKLQNPADAFGRRMSAKSQDPQIAIQQGIEAASVLPDDLKRSALEPLVKAKMMSQGKAIA